MDYFASLTFQSINFRCPEHSNPAEYFMSIMSIESMQLEGQKREDVIGNYTERIEYFYSQYQKSELKNNHKSIYPGLEPLSENDKDGRNTKWIYEFGLLFQRNLLN